MIVYKPYLFSKEFICHEMTLLISLLKISHRGTEDSELFTEEEVKGVFKEFYHPVRDDSSVLSAQSAVKSLPCFPCFPLFKKYSHRGTEEEGAPKRGHAYSKSKMLMKPVSSNTSLMSSLTFFKTT